MLSEQSSRASRTEKGQTLIELIIVITVGIIIVSALTFATISTLRNANFAKNQAQATKLAQEALERVRTGRDRDVSPIGGSFTITGNAVTSWSDPDMWRSIAGTCSLNAYFTVDPTGLLSYVACSTPIPSTIITANGFTTAIMLSDSAATSGSEKTATAIVSWSDFSGTHNSRLTTVLRKL